VGGDSEVAIKRAARLADGYFPGEGATDRLAALISRVRRAAEDVGRDPDEIEINAMFSNFMAEPEAGVEQFAELGVGRVMVPAFFFAGPGGLDRMDEFAGRAIGSAT
jgi:alkanesulfonate monooxygenase SsuD/methylene tetrahydromethanopterin reductase-like flavin-dependent oxidoreductase (luciferase family)